MYPPWLTVYKVRLISLAWASRKAEGAYYCTPRAQVRLSLHSTDDVMSRIGTTAELTSRRSTSRPGQIAAWQMCILRETKRRECNASYTTRRSVRGPVFSN